MYVSGENTILVFDLANPEAKAIKELTSKNMRPVKMVLDDEMQMLYVGSKEGSLLIFDTTY